MGQAHSQRSATSLSDTSLRVDERLTRFREMLGIRPERLVFPSTIGQPPSTTPSIKPKLRSFAPQTVASPSTRGMTYVSTKTRTPRNPRENHECTAIDKHQNPGAVPTGCEEARLPGRLAGVAGSESFRASRFKDLVALYYRRILQVRPHQSSKGKRCEVVVGWPQSTRNDTQLSSCAAISQRRKQCRRYRQRCATSAKFLSSLSMAVASQRNSCLQLDRRECHRPSDSIFITTPSEGDKELTAPPTRDVR